MDIGLVKGRHDMPVELWVLEKEIPSHLLTDFEWMEDVMYTWLLSDTCPIHVHLNLYVTGFTPIHIAFLDAWEKTRETRTGFSTLSLMHYCPVTKDYREQKWRNEQWDTE